VVSSDAIPNGVFPPPLREVLGQPHLHALYLQMTGRAYRRRGWALRVASWFHPLAFIIAVLLVFGGGRLALHVEDALLLSGGDPARLLGALALVLVLLFIALVGGAWAGPSRFPTWLANTARRGFLRDLIIAGYALPDLAAAHFHAYRRHRMSELTLLLAYLLGRVAGPGSEYFTLLAGCWLFGAIIPFAMAAQYRLGPALGSGSISVWTRVLSLMVLQVVLPVVLFRWGNPLPLLAQGALQAALLLLSTELSSRWLARVHLMQAAPYWSAIVEDRAAPQASF